VDEFRKRDVNSLVNQLERVVRELEAVA
jgi:hypothetical protein